MKDPYFGLYNYVTNKICVPLNGGTSNRLKIFLSLKEISVSLIWERNFHLPAPRAPLLPSKPLELSRENGACSCAT